MNISAKTKICMIIGDPVEHSMSPAMHNAAYKSLGIDSEFVFVASRVHINDIEKAVEAVRALGIRGLTCTVPHKIEVIKYLDEVDEIAQKIGAVNTVVNDKGVLKGYNTDWLGAVTPLEKITRIKNKKVALLGAGGAARAMAYGVLQAGANLLIINRDIEKARVLADELKCEFASLDEIKKVMSCDIIINSTIIGMGEHENESLVPKEYLNNKQIVFDAVYAPRETRLLREAKENGSKVIYGYEMLLYQGTSQFELYTGKKAPEDVMRNILVK